MTSYLQLGIETTQNTMIMKKNQKLQKRKNQLEKVYGASIEKKIELNIRIKNTEDEELQKIPMAKLEMKEEHLENIYKLIKNRYDGIG